MHPDLTTAARTEKALAVYRNRIAGAAILGLAVVAWWLGHLLGVWQGGWSSAK